MKLSEIKRISQSIAKSEGRLDYQTMHEAILHAGLDPDSFYQELEMESRYVDTHRDMSWSNSNVLLHSHAFYELLYCCTSCGAEYLVGTERYRLRRGDVVVIPPGVSHRPMLPETMTEPYKRYVIWISQAFFQELGTMFPWKRPGTRWPTYLIRTEGTCWEHLGELFLAGVQETENALPGWETAVAGNTMMLIAQLGRAMMDSALQPLKAEQPELIDQVMAYIEQNLGRKITLSETAKQFYVSESTISHLFQKKMGASFYRCVTQRRLIAAKTLIGEGVPMEEVSERVGFADYSSFYRAFRQEYGIAPRQYRKLRSRPQE